MRNLSCIKSNGYALLFLYGLLKSFSVFGGYDGETLLNNEYNEHEFLAACRTGNIEAVHYFLDQEDFDPNEGLISGVTKALVSGPFMAANNGHHEIVNILLAAEVDLNLTWHKGSTALFVAAQNGHHKVVEMLVAAEVDLNLTRDDGATALFQAAQNGHHKVVKILVENGANPFLKWKHGFNYLQTPKEQARYIRPVKLGNLCSDMAKWQRYSTIIDMLEKAEKEWKEMNPPEKKPLFFRRKKRYDPVSAVCESNLTEQTPLIGAFKRLSLKDQ